MLSTAYRCLKWQSIHYNYRSVRKLAQNSTNNEVLLGKLRQTLGESNVSIAASVREQHGKDEGHYPPIAPDIVVFARNTGDVSECHRLCYEYNTPIIPYGAGTGLEGGVNAVCGGVCIDMTAMNRVLEVNREDFDCRVEAGCDWRSLNEYLRDTGLHFPIDPGASASVGGMAATGASGTNAVAFGAMKQNVLNLEVVLPDGRVTHTSGQSCRSRKSSAGYDLTSLFVGSEGTLGTITQLCLKLSAIPECVSSGVCTFPDDKSAIDSVIETLQSSIPVARVEYLDSVSIGACLSYSKVTDLEVSPTLFLEFTGATDEEVERRADNVRQIVESNGGTNFRCSTDPTERKQLWKARHELYYSCRSLIPDPLVIITDVCVPISRLTEMIVRAKALIAREGVLGPVFGHVGDGNFHSLLIVPRSDGQALARVKAVATEMAEIALELCGTCTGEHGIGRGKVGLLNTQYDSVAMDVMRQLKKALDPKNLMNPKKLFVD